MKFIQVIYIIAIITIFSSCQKEIELVNSNETRKPAVRCVLEKDSIFKLELYKSNKPLASDTSFDLITDAVVEIIDTDGNKETLSFNGGSQMIHGLSQGFYSSNSVIDPNKDYELKITHKDYKDISSKTKFPKPSIVNNVIVSQEEVNEYDYVYNADILKFDIIDNADSKDYYQISLDYDFYTKYYVGFDTIIDGPFNERLYIRTKENSDNNITVGESETLFSDVLFNGETFSLEYIAEIIGEYEDDYMIIDAVHLNVETLSESYFKYITSVRKQQFTQGDPFSEAVLIQSNINNGLGYFGSKTLTRIKLDY